MNKKALNIKKSQQITNVDTELDNKVNKTLIEFNYFLPNCLDTSRLLSVKSKETAVFKGKDNTRQHSTSVLVVELSRTGMRYQAKLLTLSPQIDSKKSYLSI